MREIVQRDLAHLLKTTNAEDLIDRTRHADAAASTLNFGVPPLAGSYLSERKWADIERIIRRAIHDYEPRLIPETVTVVPLMKEEGGAAEEYNVLLFEIRALILHPNDFIQGTQAATDPLLLDYYNKELVYMREAASEFAASHPKIARRLGMHGIEVADPYVERLICSGCSHADAGSAFLFQAERPLQQPQHCRADVLRIGAGVDLQRRAVERSREQPGKGVKRHLALAHAGTRQPLTQRIGRGRIVHRPDLRKAQHGGPVDQQQPRAARLGHRIQVSLAAIEQCLAGRELFGRGRLDVGGDGFCFAHQHLPEQVALVGEVVIQRATGDACGDGDLGRRGVAVALADEEGAGSLDQCEARGFRAFTVGSGGCFDHLHAGCL
jgi:type VI secretion system protein ImpF